MKTVIAIAMMMSSVAMASTAKTTHNNAGINNAAHTNAAVANTQAMNNGNVAANVNANVALDCNSDAQYPVIEKSELATLIDQKAVFVVDANAKDLYLKSHIPTAVNYGLLKNEFAAKLPTDKNALIVTYCGDTNCSSWKKAAIEACKFGYTNIKHFKAGIKGWNAKI